VTFRDQHPRLFCLEVNDEEKKKFYNFSRRHDTQHNDIQYNCTHHTRYAALFTLSITMLHHYAACHYSGCRVLFIVMLSVVMTSVVMPSVIMLYVILLSVVAPFSKHSHTKAFMGKKQQKMEWILKVKQASVCQYYKHCKINLVLITNILNLKHSSRAQTSIESIDICVSSKTPRYSLLFALQFLSLKWPLLCLTQL
jgi:hypothetical protein